MTDKISALYIFSFFCLKMLSVNFQADSNSFINSSPFTALKLALSQPSPPTSSRLNSQQTSGLLLALSWLQRQRKVWYVGKGMLVATEHRTVGSWSCPQPAPCADWDSAPFWWHLLLWSFPLALKVTQEQVCRFILSNLS